MQLNLASEINPDIELHHANLPFLGPEKIKMMTLTNNRPWFVGYGYFLWFCAVVFCVLRWSDNES